MDTGIWDLSRAGNDSGPNLCMLQRPSPQNFFLDDLSDSNFTAISTTLSSSSSSSGFSEQLYQNQNVAADGFEFGKPQLVSDQNTLVDLSEQSPGLAPSSSTRNMNFTSSLANPSPSLSPSCTEVDSHEDSEIFSDMVLSYISQMLMEEDLDGKFDVYSEDPALLAAEKPFYEILGEKFPPSPDQPPLFSSLSSVSPDDTGSNLYLSSDGSSGANLLLVDNNSWPYDPVEYQQLQTNPVSVYYSSQSSLSSQNSTGNVVEGLKEPLVSFLTVSDLQLQSQPAYHFQRGLEEARKFLPSDDKLVIDSKANWFYAPPELKEERNSVVVKPEIEEGENSAHGNRGRKNPHDEDLDLLEGRSNKQSAVSLEEAPRTEIFDSVLLCNGEKMEHELRIRLQNEVSKNSHGGHSEGSSSGGGRGRGRKQSKKEVVDLSTLLIHCAQSVATDDRRSANELLKQIRQHSSPCGDANQRLAHYFADGLEARLAGTGSQVYRSLVSNKISVTDILKGYQLYMASCPFKKICYFFSNQTILNVAEKATRLHIIDFGIHYGFQWPCFMQTLSSRPGGPPRLRITGIDFPMPGFRPTELIDETGRRLSDYARKFNIPFEFHAIAAKWETVRVEDLNIDEDEVLVVNCLFGFKNLLDETVVVESPRNMVLDTIRKLMPVVFIHGIVNGSFSAPFFVTRFREALFYYSSMFDMVETNMPRENEFRQCIERIFFARTTLNVISCEGSERTERPETYKQWQVRKRRAGFTQLPLDRDIVKKAKDKVKACYHKDFVVDQDSQWLLQGWKGRIAYALSTWKPNYSS